MEQAAQRVLACYQRAAQPEHIRRAALPREYMAPHSVFRRMLANRKRSMGSWYAGARAITQIFHPILLNISSRFADWLRRASTPAEGLKWAGICILAAGVAADNLLHYSAAIGCMPMNMSRFASSATSCTGLADLALIAIAAVLLWRAATIHSAVDTCAAVA